MRRTYFCVRRLLFFIFKEGDIVLAGNEKVVFRWSRQLFKGDDGYGIHIVRMRSDNQFAVVKGFDVPKAKNCWVVASGKWVPDKKHDKAFVVTYSEIEIPTTAKGVVPYLRALRIGLGEKYASKLCDKFGAAIWNILDVNPDELNDVEGVPKRLIKRLRKKWEEAAIKRNLMQLFGEAPEFTPKMADRVAKRLGSSAIGKITKNPYLLCRMANLPFKTVDSVARKMKEYAAKPYTMHRLGTAFYCVLKSASLSGHVCLPADTLIAKSLLLLNNGVFKERLTDRQVRNCLRKTVKDGWLKNCGKMIYIVESYEDEKRLAENLLRLFRAGLQGAEYATIVVGDVLESYMKQNNIVLAKQQCKAVQAAFLEPVSIVTGGPGTGKTTLTKAILQMDREMHGSESEPVLLAPTGRAARRLAEATGHAAQTVHSAIGYRGEEEPADEDKKISGSIVIVDEASMLDQHIASLLVEKVESKTRVVFIGDSDQLPSVGAGNVLAEIIRSGVIPVTRLEVVFRQTGDHNPILINSDKIHHGRTNLLYNDRFRYVECHTEQAQHYHAYKEYINGVKKYGIDNVMLLNPYRSEKKTMVNVASLNRAIQLSLNPPTSNKPHMIVGKQVFTAGDRVMQTKNTESTQNGDIGTVVRIFDRENEDDPTQTDTIMEIDFSGMRVEYTKEDAQNLTLAYCCTVHKSQGAEYQMIIMVVSNYHEQLLQRNLLYTGITRAKQEVCLVGNILGVGSAVTKSINNTKSAIRYTCLAYQLRKLACKPTQAENIADIT